MKQLFSIVLLLSLSTFSYAGLEDFSISLEEAKEILGKPLGDEIFLKERLRLENAQKRAGEIISHKVGNGFQIPGPNPTIEEFMRCKVLGSDELQFILFRTEHNQTVAVFTADPTQENKAEFLNVEEFQTSARFKRERFFTGHNALRAEMFQLKLEQNDSAFLTIVIDQKLYRFKMSCAP